MECPSDPAMPEITAVLWQLHVLLLWIQLGRPLICLIIGGSFGENILFSEVLRYLWISQTMCRSVNGQTYCLGKESHCAWWELWLWDCKCPGKQKGWEVWWAKNTACVAWMSYGGVRCTGHLGWHFSHWNSRLNLLLVPIWGHYPTILNLLWFTCMSRAVL